VGGAYSYYVIRITLVKKQKEELEKQVQDRTNELFIQAENLSIAYTEIQESIRSALEIQKSILPSEMLIKSKLPQSFILYKPKDVVSGDFYWFNEKNDEIIIAAVDCTGHGVSGALMTITGHHLLNNIIHPSRSLVASEILNKLNDAIITELHPNFPNIQFGMDISLCILNKERSKLQYAGANQPLYILRGAEIIQVKADKYSIGPDVMGRANKFTNHEISLMPGDRLYLFTDGYADQFGGKSGRDKFLYSRFRELLTGMKDENMDTQVSILDRKFAEWRGDAVQLDDILVIGFKV
jgi:serine phosphatase RsbU (regulator of sigma subunit)